LLSLCRSSPTGSIVAILLEDRYSQAVFHNFAIEKGSLKTRGDGQFGQSPSNHQSQPAQTLDRRNTMRSNMQDQTEDTFHKILGKLGEVTRKLSENMQLEAKGNAEKIAGKF